MRRESNIPPKNQKPKLTYDYQAKTVVAPLDRVKILFQTSTPEYTRYRGSWHGFLSAISVIRRNEGTRGLFKGHSATLLQKFPYAAINFLRTDPRNAYPVQGQGDAIPQTSVRQPCGGVSTPARATDTNETLFNKLSQRFKLANFYRGFSPTLLGMIPYAGMSFFTHDQVGDWLRRPALAPYTTIPNSVTKPGSRHAGRPQLIAPAELSAGALAGVVAQTTSYPFEVLRRRMQVGGHRLGIGGTCRKMWAENGFRGFWVGLSIGYFKVVPLVATSFLVYERLKWAFGI
ncbi:mitochondrial carrier protein (Leu5) [Penicillium lagena]|uniref:mitochondrial carrier protein (Leu5) n=1 Tax=Penicillium lagena TaxID=94218 RepID=UPI0025403349|nr:mitochondrial carrier protein (Leu5) [Penicillium lagena]KAJ5612644.1 mitochondrial carrier protein (Leu5) [Penicillium lagena]